MDKWIFFYNKYCNIKGKLNDLVKLFQLYIFNAAFETYGIKKYNNNSYIYFTKKEKFLRKTKKKIQNQINNIKNKINYSKNKCKLFKLLKNKKKTIK